MPLLDNKANPNSREQSEAAPSPTLGVKTKTVIIILWFLKETKILTTSLVKYTHS